MINYKCDNCFRDIKGDGKATLRIYDQENVWGVGIHLCPLCYKKVKQNIKDAIIRKQEQRAEAQAYLSTKGDNDL